MTGGWTVQSLLNITELQEPQLAYWEVTARMQWACVESFFIFPLWHEVVQVFLLKMQCPGLQFNKIWHFELERLQWELTKIMDLRQFHLKAVISTFTGAKNVVSMPLPATSIVACSYPFTLLQLFWTLNRYHHESLIPQGSLLNEWWSFRALIRSYLSNTVKRNQILFSKKKKRKKKSILIPSHASENVWVSVLTYRCKMQIQL